MALNLVGLVFTLQKPITNYRKILEDAIGPLSTGRFQSHPNQLLR
jgi:hypothetical protein